MNRIKAVLEAKGFKQTQNRQQPRLEITFEKVKILDIEVKQLIVEPPKTKTTVDEF